MILPGNVLILKISNLVDDFNQNFHPNTRGQALSKTPFIFVKYVYFSQKKLFNSKFTSSLATQIYIMTFNKNI